jgi:homoserine kinase
MVKCPATSANLGPGFDIFGLALQEPFDTLKVESRPVPGVTVETGGKYGAGITTRTEENVAGFVAMRMLENFEIKSGLNITIEKGIRPGSGMGSSAASAMGVAAAVDRIFGLGLGPFDVIEWGALGEMLSGGDPHVDNVSAAYLGGFVVITRRYPLHVAKYEPHHSLKAVIALPAITKLSTHAARLAIGPALSAISPAEWMMALEEACGIVTGRMEDIMRALSIPTHIEVRREERGFYKFLKEAKELGCQYGAAVAGSGAGPSLIALTTAPEAATVANALRALYKEKGLACETFITAPSSQGIQELMTAI